MLFKINTKMCSQRVRFHSRKEVDKKKNCTFTVLLLLKALYLKM